MPRQLKRSIPQIPDVDPVEPQQRPPCRERACRRPVRAAADLAESGLCRKATMRQPTPVVEVSGDHQRCIPRHCVRDQVEQPLQLNATMRLTQSKMNADGVQWQCETLHVDHAVKQSARFGASDRYVEVLPPQDRMLREERVALVAASRDRIAAVCVLRPDLVREHFVVLLANVSGAVAADFLEEHQVGGGSAQCLPDPAEQRPATQRTQALVRIERQDPQGRPLRGAATAASIVRICCVRARRHVLS